MRATRFMLLILVAATLLLAASCGGKKPGNVIPEGLSFAEQDNGEILVEGQQYAGEELEIPALTADGKTVTEIGSFAFFHLTNLKKVTIPGTITVINGSAFEGCTALTGIVIPSSVERIAPSAFEGCTSLTSVTISPYIVSIGSDAFAGCTALTEITFEGSMDLWKYGFFRSDAWVEDNKTITIHCTDGDVVLGTPAA